ncbi:flippase [Parahaliea sp. F7430]|uniref:Flippase n=1 Tax=Sediminihaliea albiluteola TaxID=2758564 RepID=A0A7W2YJ62_9GAMM|nr:flippase [Sediminihaliea albiluteola]MBA6412294.1 flippase [Sediminihaliea albiluteola]
MIIKSSLVKSFFGLGAVRLLSIPLSLMTSVILARELGPESFGQYSFIMSLVAIIVLPVSAGLPQLLTREIAAYLNQKNWALYRGVLHTAHLWVLISSLAIIGLYFLINTTTSVIPEENKWKLLSIAIFMILFQGLGAIRDGAIKGLGKPIFSETPSQLIQPILVIITYFILSSLNLLNVKTAIMSQVLIAGVVFLIASWIFYCLQPLEKKFSSAKYKLKAWVPALIPFTLLALVGTFNSQIGIVVLGLLSSDDQIAALRIADRGATFVALSLSLVNIIIAPHIVRSFQSKDRNGLQRLAKQSARGAFCIALPICFILILAGERLIDIVFGADYAPMSYYPMIILALAQLINVFFGSVGYLLSMSGYANDALKGHIIGLLSNIILCGLLIPQYGALGAAIGISVSVLIWNCVLSYLVYIRLNVISLVL